MIHGQLLKNSDTAVSWTEVSLSCSGQMPVWPLQLALNRTSIASNTSNLTHKERGRTLENTKRAAAPNHNEVTGEGCGELSRNKLGGGRRNRGGTVRLRLCRIPRSARGQPVTPQWSLLFQSSVSVKDCLVCSDLALSHCIDRAVRVVSLNCLLHALTTDRTDHDKSRSTLPWQQVVKSILPTGKNYNKFAEFTGP